MVACVLVERGKKKKKKKRGKKTSGSSTAADDYLWRAANDFDALYPVLCLV